MTYDPDLIDRLVREAREADMLDSFREFGDSYLIKTKRGEYGTYDVVLALERAHTMADQLGAARREVDGWRRKAEVAIKLFGETQGDVELMRPVVDAAEGYVHGPNLIGSVIDAVDAYRAAKGKT